MLLTEERPPSPKRSVSGVLTASRSSSGPTPARQGPGVQLFHSPGARGPGSERPTHLPEVMG